MKKSEVKRFTELHNRHLKLFKLQGKSKNTIDAYSRAVRRIRDHYDCCPDILTKSQLENYFGELVETHSGSTVKIDRLGLMLFWKHVLEQDWQWLDIIKPPQVKSIPDILSPSEIEQLICATKKMRYRVFLLATYSMGLRLTEVLSLEVRDIDSERKLVHIRRGKGHKDRMVPLPDRTLQALQVLWSKHRHPRLLLQAILRCRTPDSGELYVQCPDCKHREWPPLSCGNRHCPRCQNHECRHGCLIAGKGQASCP